MELVGYQTQIEWRGQSILTLADVWPASPRAMIVGLNPAPKSVTAGHYYQGQSGQRQMRRLVAAGLMSEPAGSNFEEVALAARVGFTDLVKQPTVGEGDLGRSELSYGKAELLRILAARQVPLIVCVFRHPVAALLGQAETPGLQQKRTETGAQVFRMPGPFQAAAKASAVMGELSQLLAD